MKFFQRAQGIPSRLGILPGTFNPVTVAHRALAHAGLQWVDELVLVLPNTFPHKPYSGASFEERIRMLETLFQQNASFSIATTQSGLFVDIAAECRTVYGPDTTLTFLCGRDAAERIAGWDYGYPGAFLEMLRQFQLLVAARAGEYEVPSQLDHAIRKLELPGLFDHVSATEVRERIARGDTWEHLVPPPVQEQVRRIYG